MKNNFPDLGLSFRKMKLIDELERTVNDDNAIGFAIKKAFMDKEPPSAIIKTIKEIYEDNNTILIGIISERLLTDLKITFNFIEKKDIKAFNALEAIDRDIID